MSKLFFIGTILFLFCSLGFAETNDSAVNTMDYIDSQTNENKPFFHNYIGIYGGLTTGYGISYRYWNDWGIQVVFAPYISSSQVVVDLGVVGLKDLSYSRWSKFFLYLGTSVTYNYYSAYYGYYGSASPYSYFNINVGCGPGMELILLDNIGLDLMFGIGLYNQVTDKVSTTMSFTAEGGIFYMF